MNKTISMSDMVVIINEQVELGGKVEFTPRGVSMLPMLRNNKDIVVLKKKPDRLKKYDLPLYVRDNGKYVLHRVVKVCDDGSYVMCGDNHVTKEPGITHEQIIAVVCEFTRKGKKYSCNDLGYRCYCRIWYAILPLRYILRRMRRILGKLKRFMYRIAKKLLK